MSIKLIVVAFFSGGGGRLCVVLTPVVSNCLFLFLINLMLDSLTQILAFKDNIYL